MRSGAAVRELAVALVVAAAMLAAVVWYAASEIAEALRCVAVAEVEAPTRVPLPPEKGDRVVVSASLPPTCEPDG